MKSSRNAGMVIVVLSVAAGWGFPTPAAQASQWNVNAQVNVIGAGELVNAVDVVFPADGVYTLTLTASDFRENYGTPEPQRHVVVHGDSTYGDLRTFTLNGINDSVTLYCSHPLKLFFIDSPPWWDNSGSSTVEVSNESGPVDTYTVDGRNNVIGASVDPNAVHAYESFAQPWIIRLAGSNFRENAGNPEPQRHIIVHGDSNQGDLRTFTLNGVGAFATLDARNPTRLFFIDEEPWWDNSGSSQVNITDATGLLPLDWTVDATPVLSPPDDAGGGTVIKDGSLYRAWMNDAASGANQVVYTESTDGIVWTSPVPVYTPAGGNDANPEVVFRDGTYYMWVGATGGATSVDVATSPDGVNDWTHLGWVADWSAYTVMGTDEGFEAWFRPFSDVTCFYRATSTDGLNWQNQSCALAAGGPGEFDENISTLEVTKIAGVCHMWYGGHAEGEPQNCLAYAISFDGLNWEKYGRLTGFEAVADSTEYPSVEVDGDLLRMWFHVANSNSLSHASTLLADCDTNGIYDSCDLACGDPWDECRKDACGTAADCNENGVPDECDLADETSDDCNTNGIPDECEADFDGDGTIDDCDEDVDGDGVVNDEDACDYTPPGANIVTDPQDPLHGTLRGDLDGDCDCDLADFAIFQGDLTGVNG